MMTLVGLGASLIVLGAAVDVAEGIGSESDDRMAKSTMYGMASNINTTCEEGEPTSGNVELPPQADLVIEDDRVKVEGINFDEEGEGVSVLECSLAGNSIEVSRDINYDVKKENDGFTVSAMVISIN